MLRHFQHWSRLRTGWRNKASCQLQMDLKVLHDKPTIFNFLKEDIGLQLYLIGDLDDFFWSKTIWYSLTEADTIKAIALL